MNKGKVDQEMEAIKGALSKFTKNKVFAKTNSCPRAFCMVILQENYYPNTGKTLFKYKNYRNIVGPQEQIDLLLKTFENQIKGSF